MKVSCIIVTLRFGHHTTMECITATAPPLFFYFTKLDRGEHGFASLATYICMNQKLYWLDDTQNDMTFPFTKLLDDAIIYLLSILPVSDILIMLQICKKLSKLTKLRIIWCNKFSTAVLSVKVPIPGKSLPLQELSQEGLEWRTKLALRLKQHWKHPSPNIFKEFTLPPSWQKILNTILLSGGIEVLTLHPDSIVLWGHNGTGLKLPLSKMDDWTCGGALSAVVRDSALNSRIAVSRSVG
ncbi:hypothetical protein C8Q75DRAFT_522927 [Abortiporus biennis]|nr:hypothetical protein C8Q75DRAFT_522927 [Abortiporus biennis]